MKFRFVIALLTVLALAFGVSAQDSELTLTVLGTYETGIFDEGAQEIGAYDPSSGRLFTTNAQADSIDILDMSSPSELSLIGQISLEDYGAGINSVAVYNSLVTAAVQGAEKTDNGMAVFMDTDGNVLNAVEVGALPDMITFTPDGNYALTANEGEPNDEYTVDPEGS
ncbi:MAG: alkaline phosphatase, partial [Anaerolineae bacterium]|nr:alkaline phosphatase [Anaerolineae bacterium]